MNDSIIVFKISIVGPSLFVEVGVEGRPSANRESPLADLGVDGVTGLTDADLLLQGNIMNAIK